MKALFLPLLLLLSAASCKKDDDPASVLPPATQEGKNTGGCFVNGQPFVAQEYGGGPLSSPIRSIDGGFYFDSLYYLTLNGKLNEQAISISLFLRRPKPGTFLLNQNTKSYPYGLPESVLNNATYRIIDSDNDYKHEVYATNAQYTGQVLLTRASKTDRISAGTFSFTAVSNQDPTKTITIKDGRFDRRQ